MSKSKQSDLLPYPNSPSQTPPSFTRVAQPAPKPPRSLQVGMEKYVRFSQGNQAEGEQLANQYIQTTHTFYQIEEYIESLRPDKTRIWKNLMKEKTQKGDQIRSLQQHPLVREILDQVPRLQQQGANKPGAFRETNKAHSYQKNSTATSKLIPKLSQPSSSSQEYHQTSQNPASKFTQEGHQGREIFPKGRISDKIRERGEGTQPPTSPLTQYSNAQTSGYVSHPQEKKPG